LPDLISERSNLNAIQQLHTVSIKTTPRAVVDKGKSPPQEIKMKSRYNDVGQQVASPNSLPQHEQPNSMPTQIAQQLKRRIAQQNMKKMLLAMINDQQ